MFGRTILVSILLLCASAAWAFLPQLEGSGPVNSAVAAIPDECRPPERVSAEIEALWQRLRSAPNPELYHALGTLYGRNSQFRCAITAFNAALTLSPTATQTRYALALALIQDHQPRRAADEVRTVLRQQPDSFAAHNALGLALQDSGDSEAAASEFKRALHVNPSFALAHYDLAQLLRSQKGYKAAAYHLKQGLAASPSPELASKMKTALGVVYAQLGQYGESIPLFQEAVAADPESADVHSDLATAYAHRENYIEAVKEYKQVLRLDPKRIDVQLLLAKALLNQSSVEECLPYLRDYVGQRPNDSEGLEILGDALKESSSHLSEALDVLQRATQLNPSSYKAHYDLGVVLGRSGRLPDAIRALQTAMRLKPDGSEARYQLAQMLAKAKRPPDANEQFAMFERLKNETQQRTKAQFLGTRANDLLREGRDQDAVAAYRQALAITPDDPKLRYNFAVALSKSGDRSASQLELQVAIKLDPKFAQAHSQLGSSYMEDGRLQDAVREFRAARENDPQSAEALNNLGTVLGRQGHSQEAEQLFRRAIDVDPEAPLGFVNLGLMLASERKYAEAEEEFRSALRLDAENTSALTGLGMLLGKTGRSAESIDVFRKVAALSPSSPDAHLNLGIALADSNDLRGALDQFSDAVRLGRNSAPGYYNRGRVLYALRRNDEAERSLEAAVKLSPNYVDALLLLGVIEHTSPRATGVFQRVVELEPDNAQARFYLGRNLLQEGKKAEAIAQWKRAVASDPENVAALSNLARVLAQDKNPEAGEYMAKFQAAQQTQQTSERVKELNNFALRSAEGQNWDKAVGQLREAIDLCNHCVHLGVLRKNIGLIYARKGDAERARQELQLALRLLPDGADMVAATEALRQLNTSPDH